MQKYFINIKLYKIKIPKIKVLLKKNEIYLFIKICLTLTFIKITKFFSINGFPLKRVPTTLLSIQKKISKFHDTLTFFKPSHVSIQTKGGTTLEPRTIDPLIIDSRRNGSNDINFGGNSGIK